MIYNTSKDFLQSLWHYVENENYTTVIREKQILMDTEHNTGYQYMLSIYYVTALTISCNMIPLFC